MLEPASTSFPTDLETIESRIKEIQPRVYASTRNFVDGQVTYLSPYISRGVISTRQVYEYLIQSGETIESSQKLIQELCWRDYWQSIWREKGDEIDQDLRQEQGDVQNAQVPTAIIHGKTGIEAVDQAISYFYSTGYMHNHMRMYVASIACNIAKCHWFEPARWMYANLLDGDWASNALSWQWVAGTNSNKKYYANQENINRYFYTSQSKSFLNVEYDQFPLESIPETLKECGDFSTEMKLPVSDLPLVIDSEFPVLIYNYYNLDPKWHSTEPANRVLLLEPSFFKKYPVNQHCIDFVLNLGENIPNLQVFVGEFDQMTTEIGDAKVVYKEHPTNTHYVGTEEARDWIYDTQKEHRSFFSFWKAFLKTQKS